MAKNSCFFSIFDGKKITLQSLKESKKLEAYGWGLNPKEVVGLTLQSSLIEIREWTPKL